MSDDPKHPDFAKTDVYGLFKPGAGSLDHGRLHNVNWDLLGCPDCAIRGPGEAPGETAAAHRNECE
jgi:hypothetical protein